VSPQRNGRHVASVQAGEALQNPAYRPADAYKNEGFGVTAGPLAIWQGARPRRDHLRRAVFALRAPYPGSIARKPVELGDVLNRALPCIRAAVALATVAIVAGGCAAANNATSSQASAQGEQPYKTAYGLSSAGTTTDLYTEIFGPSQPAPATTVASAQPTQPVTAQPITPAQQPTTASGAARPGQTATVPNRQYPNQTAANRAPPPASVQPAPTQVAQQPAPPQPPPEPDVPTAYGITANGPTTDLYTEIFGPRRQ